MGSPAVIQPPAGYKSDPKPPAGYALDQAQTTTNQGEPGWVREAVGTPSVSLAYESPATQEKQGYRTVAYVDPSNKPTSQINVVTPSEYDAPTAAHETTHLYQNSRNSDFTEGLSELDRKQSNQPATYDYGGTKGLKANPQKSVGDYNREQQASMVEDLARTQNKTHPHMTPKELAEWDKTKHTLERPIEQLQRVPAADHSVSSKVDDWIGRHTNLGHPLEEIEGIVSPPKIKTPAPAAPEPSSVALGYAEPSKYVR